MTLPIDPQYTPSSRMIIIVGNYGSGKTEVAVNMAMQLRGAGKKVTIVDLDIVNPYFRCREAQELMKAVGIEVVIPPGSQQYADLPIIVPQVKGLMGDDGDEEEYVIFDVGGDDVGATPLSSLFETLSQKPYQLIQIINTRRPFTGTVEGCLKMRDKIETSSRLKINGLAVNTHLVTETDVNVILEGYELAKEVSRQSGIPLEFVTAMGDLADAPELRELSAPVFKLDRIMLPPWLQDEQKNDNSSSEQNNIPAERTKPIFRP